MAFFTAIYCCGLPLSFFTAKTLRCKERFLKIVIRLLLPTAAATCLLQLPPAAASCRCQLPLSTAAYYYL